jgi:hypothetical protein
MRVAICFLILMFVASITFSQEEESFHRAEQDREIIYWLHTPETHQFSFSHDFNIVRPGQKYAHSFVRKGSTVTDDITFIDLDTGKRLKTQKVTGKDVNELGYYPEPTDAEDIVVQGELLAPVPNGGSVRIRVKETYTDAERYYVDKNGGFVWDRTFGRPRNVMVLPSGWMLVSCSFPSIISEDKEGRIVVELNNPHNDELHVVLHGKLRPVSQ